MTDKPNPIDLTAAEVWQNDVGVWHGCYRLANGAEAEVPFNSAESGTEAQKLFAEFLSVQPDRIKIVERDEAQ
jgi:hypothetical protein